MKAFMSHEITCGLVLLDALITRASKLAVTPLIKLTRHILVMIHLTPELPRLLGNQPILASLSQKHVIHDV